MVTIVSRPTSRATRNGGQLRRNVEHADRRCPLPLASGFAYERLYCRQGASARSMDTPVLLCVFNRPRRRRRQWTACGPFGRPGSTSPPMARARATQPMANAVPRYAGSSPAVDWPCQVHTLFRERNLGCKLVGRRRDQLVLRERRGRPHPRGRYRRRSRRSSLCAELLARYRDDKRIGIISGCNFTPGGRGHIPGQLHLRAEHQPMGMGDLAPRLEASRPRHERLERSSQRCVPAARIMMRPGPRSRRGNGTSTTPWIATSTPGTIRWLTAVWRHGLISIDPGGQSDRQRRHGRSRTPRIRPPRKAQCVVDSPTRPLLFPLHHPAEVKLHPTADAIIDREVFTITPARSMHIFAKIQFRKVRRFLSGLQARSP